MRRLAHSLGLVLACSLELWGCSNHAPQRAFAGRLTVENLAQEGVPGPASQGLPGDFFLRNDRIRAVIQAPGRAMGPCPWGGNLLDLDFADSPAGDQLGEVSPLFGLGRTANFTKVEVTRDGSDGGPAVITAVGPDAIDDFINIIGIAGFTVAAISPSLSPQIALGLEVTATYTLKPGDEHVHVDYGLRNVDDQAKKILFGTLTDTGADIELFHPGVGYGEFAITDFVTGAVPTVEYVALQAQGVSYGIIPVERDPQARAAPLPVAGVAVEAYEQRSFSDALTPAGENLALGGRAQVTRSIDVVLARGGAGAIESAVRALTGTPTGTVAGTVTGGGAGARIAVSRSSGDPATALVTTFVADAQGAFSGALPPGDYVLEAEGDGFRRAPTVPLHVGAGAQAQAQLALPDQALLSYRVTDEKGAPVPAKLFVLGTPPNAPDRRFRDTIKDPLPYGVVGYLASLRGDSSRGDAHDHPLALAPGHYRVVISRGPEWSRFEEELDLPSSGVTVQATLQRVVDTGGYLACDFHQHTFISPDSPVSPEERVVANLADGTEYLSSSEHDVHFDFRPVIEALSAQSLMGSGVGVESTPFDYGHFIAYPLRIDASSPNGGALDWGNAGAGDLAPAQIFDGLRALGAEVVQVNHPRTPPLNVSYQQNFDRAALTFDFLRHTFFSDKALLEVSAKDLGLPDDAALFSPSFNAHEVYLGFWPQPDPTVPDRELQDVLVNTNLRDFFDFLSFGFTPTAVGDSDTHQRMSVPSGLPRTLVRVPDDSPQAIAAGVGDEVVRTMSGQAPRDVVVTNGPMVSLFVGNDPAAGGIGKTFALPSGATQLGVHVRAQAAAWAPFDTVEVYVNQAFTVPPPQGQQPEPLQPALCFTQRVPASSRCQKALGGARPLVVSSTDAGGGRMRLQASADASVLVSDLLQQARPGAVGKDLWLVARVTGIVGLYPVIPQAVDPKVVPVADLVAGKPLVNQGVPALAFTNPVFVDVDGGGWRAPFAP